MTHTDAADDSKRKSGISLRSRIRQAILYRWAQSIYVGSKRSLDILSDLLTTKKPSTITWRDFMTIQLTPIRYQPLLFPNDQVISHRRDKSILDSRDKLAAIELPGSLVGKTVLDIGCAEGFFVIQATLRGAERAIGCDIMESRLRIARVVAKAWQLQDRVWFSATGLYDIPPEWASDIVLCFAVAHHLHGSPGEPGFHDTWRMISNPLRAKYVDNMLRAVAAVSSLTKEVTYWEYSFEYGDHKPKEVDHAALGRLWVQKGLYEQVEFIGLSQILPAKDRALYRAFK